MKLIFSFIAFSILLILQSTADDGELKSIFNGKDLTGWDVPDNNIWFTVKDGVLKLENGPQKKGQTLWTSDEYENFEMEFDFKMGKGTVDSGVYVNSREQIQIGISGSLKRDMTGSPYISGKGYQLRPKGVKELLKLDDWNTMKICAEGKKYTVWLGGKIMTYESDSAIKKRKIGIQLHRNRVMSIEYRNLKARSLK